MWRNFDWMTFGFACCVAGIVLVSALWFTYG